MRLVFPRNEPNLQRGTEKNCQVCNKKFSVMIRQHQCKRCLKAVCSDCGNFKNFTFSNSNIEKEQHRICKSCKDSSDYITSLIKNKNLKFGEMSIIGKEWLKRIVKIPQTYGIHTQQHKVFTKEVFSQLWGSYSFQLRELIGLLTHQYQQSSIYDLVYQAYATVVSAFEGLSLTKIIYLIMYALCFCSLDKAIVLVLYLLKLKKQQQYIQNLTFKFIKALHHPKQFYNISNYITYRYEKYIDSFYVNSSSIECSVFYIGEILKKNSLEDLFMFFSSHIYNNREILYIIAPESSRDIVDLMMLRNCALIDITSNFKQIKNKNIILSNDENQFKDKLKKIQNGTLSAQRKNDKQATIISQQDVSSIKPQLIKGQIAANKGQTTQDSFSQYPQDEKLQQFSKFLQSCEVQKQNEQLVTTQEINSFKKMAVQDKNLSLNLQKCFDCQISNKACQVLEKNCSKLNRQNAQLKDKTIIFQAEILRLKKQTKQFDDQLVQLVHQKKTLQKALQQTKKQLDNPINSIKITADSQVYKKKLQQSQKQTQIQINKQQQIIKRYQSIQSKLNETNLALEQSSKTIQQLKFENESLKQEKQTISGIINVLKSDKKLLENKSNNQSTKIQELQTTIIKQFDQNKFLEIKKGEISRELQAYKHLNKKYNQKIKILQEQMAYISDENTKLNKQINGLIEGWKDKQFRFKEENKFVQIKTAQLELTIFSLEQQLKVHTSNSNQDMKDLLEQNRKQYQQRLQRQIKMNNQLLKEVKQLQKIVADKQTEMDNIQKDNLQLLNQLQQKGKINEQLSQKLTSLNLRNREAIAVENDIRNKYQELRLKAERNELQIQKKNNQIVSLTQNIASKNAQIVQLQSKIKEDISLISELKKQLQIAKQNSTKSKHHQQISVSHKSNLEQMQPSKQKQKKMAILAEQNTSLRDQLIGTNQINDFLKTRCLQMSKQIDQINQDYQKMTQKILNVEDQNRHTKFQLQKSNKQNMQLKSTIKHVQTLLSQKQEEIKNLNRLNQKKNPSLGQKLVFEKMKEIQAKNQELKHQIKESQKQREGLLNKMDQLSTLMMGLQGQKLQLGEQNFYLKQILKNNNINF